jgi:uncharacterized ubiquitin-like protein YukD
MVIHGIAVNDPKIMVIDVANVLQSKKELGSKCIIDYIHSFSETLETLIIIVGKKLTISTVERESSFIRDLAKMFYSIDDCKISQCHLINTPRTFSTIFACIKPLLTADVVKMINIVKDKDISAPVKTEYVNF